MPQCSKEQNNRFNNENNININFNNIHILMGKNQINIVPDKKVKIIKEIHSSEVKLYLNKEFILSLISTSFYVKI